MTRPRAWDAARRYGIAATHSNRTGEPTRRVALECAACGQRGVMLLGDRRVAAECEVCGARGTPEQLLANLQQPRRAAA